MKCKAPPSCLQSCGSCFERYEMEESTFSLDDYHGVGFDLDCTLAEYNVKELIKLVYKLLADYLIKNKSYESEHLLKSFEEDEFFLQKGLVMDFKKGNVLKMGGEGQILKATHGTTCLSDEEIVKQYGPEKTFRVFKEFLGDPLLILNSQCEKSLRASLDCFDMACILIFARTVDHLDKKKSVEPPGDYNIWPDILAGLYQLYTKNYFATGESEFFLALRNNPSLYYKKWTPEKLMWLKELKSKKFVFLITGSYIDFASLTASYCIGENWKDYFDVVLCFARKPAFFFAGNPFFNIEYNKETEPVKGKGLQLNSVYSQGNWETLKALISEQTHKKKPKCVYIGDNLFLDVYAPVHFKCCDSVAVSLELKDEFRSSPFWGSYFGEVDRKGASYWNHLIKKYAKICISGLDVFLNKPLNFEYSCLKSDEPSELNEINGFYIK